VNPDSPQPAPEVTPPVYTPGDLPLPEKVYEALQAVEDPEIHQNIVGLGLIYGVEIAKEARKVTVKMTLTTPYCPYGPQLLQETKMVILSLPGVKEAQVDVVWEPTWDPKTMASEDVKDALGLW
jgi:metal-sulfur cluster biosynthetic enzyme